MASPLCGISSRRTADGLSNLRGSMRLAQQRGYETKGLQTEYETSVPLLSILGRRRLWLLDDESSAAATRAAFPGLVARVEERRRATGHEMNLTVQGICTK